MDCVRILFVLILGVLTTHGRPQEKAFHSTVPCGDQGMAKYNLTFATFWTEGRFPKQFPTFRPHAQWAKMIGRTHSSQYRLFEEGSLCSAGVMEYVEKGSTEDLDNDVQGVGGILDIFNTRPMDLGIGITSVNVLADPYHSTVSVMARLIPSPDWFVGVDSMELCKNGQWVDTLTIDLPPYDAGTDRGFTFTAPNWPEIPYKEIYQITSKMPNHPANSFFYPEHDVLPTIATLTVVKVETISDDNAFNFVKEKETLNDDTASRRPHFQPKEPVVFGEQPPKKKKDDVKYEFNMFRTDMRPKAYTPAAPTTEATTTTTTTTTRPLPHVPRDRVNSLSSRIKSTRIGQNILFPQSCRVSEWQEWSACSKTCGYGTRMRTRVELQAAEDGGAPCPVLTEEELCGSMRSCTWNHFGTLSGGGAGGKSGDISAKRNARRRSLLFRRRKMRRQQQQKKQKVADE